jgi:hypothetical protein
MKKAFFFSLLGGVIVFLQTLPAFSFDGDFDNDYQVNGRDWAIFAQAWLTQTGDPNFNPLCDISDPKDNLIDHLDLVAFVNHWLHRSILLPCYSNGWGTLLKTMHFYDEGTYTFDINDPNPYGQPPGYYAYAFRQGFYTEMYTFTGILVLPPPGKYRVNVTIDLDPVITDTFNGTIFLTQVFFAPAALQNTDVTAIPDDPDANEVVFHTDAQGRFSTELSAGFYTFSFTAPDGNYVEPVHIGPDQTYGDFFFRANVQAMKPNIYLYPEQPTSLTLTIGFPHGGQVVDSLPLYQEGWQITVEPSGLIDGQYRYLFYESIQPDYGQYSAGWVVPWEGLESFFRNNMTQTGFNQTEIDDFLSYWIPRLVDHPYYAIYPQYDRDLENISELQCSSPPDSLIRLFYAIRGLQDNRLILPPPAIPAFSRQGFTVAEWGVILK